MTTKERASVYRKFHARPRTKWGMPEHIEKVQEVECLVHWVIQDCMNTSDGIE